MTTTRIVVLGFLGAARAVKYSRMKAEVSVHTGHLSDIDPAGDIERGRPDAATKAKMKDDMRHAITDDDLDTLKTEISKAISDEWPDTSSVIDAFELLFYACQVGDKHTISWLLLAGASYDISEVRIMNKSNGYDYQKPVWVPAWNVMVFEMIKMAEVEMSKRPEDMKKLIGLSFEFARTSQDPVRGEKGTMETDISLRQSDHDVLAAAWRKVSAAYKEEGFSISDIIDDEVEAALKLLPAAL